MDRDAEAHRQWVAYYVSTGRIAAARQLGWVPSEEQEAALRLQARARREGGWP